MFVKQVAGGREEPIEVVTGKEGNGDVSCRPLVGAFLRAWFGDDHVKPGLTHEGEKNPGSWMVKLSEFGRVWQDKVQPQIIRETLRVEVILRGGVTVAPHLQTEGVDLEEEEAMGQIGIMMLDVEEEGEMVQEGSTVTDMEEEEAKVQAQVILLDVGEDGEILREDDMVTDLAEEEAMVQNRVIIPDVQEEGAVIKAEGERRR
ncbi:hypothetical protein HK097_007418 [Rhizophlyctis rosea]|uniref:Uncharacterized protein n=1 Tax=Rhizophlyctis rosea TaxID=64517 RepID=A0AAD5SEN4_9FUNG|nr:hypothetical protein HK097_007418 [Rhizophlyctis rosea]